MTLGVGIIPFWETDVERGVLGPPKYGMSFTSPPQENDDGIEVLLSLLGGDTVKLELVSHLDDITELSVGSAYRDSSFSLVTLCSALWAMWISIFLAKTQGEKIF